MSRRMDARTVGAKAAADLRGGDAITRRLARPIRILHPVWRLAVGGLERQLVEVVNGLSRDRFQHVVLVRGWNEESEALGRRIEKHVELLREPAESGGAWPRRLASLIRERRIDMVHVRGLSMLPDAVMAADWVGDVPVMFSFHGFESADAAMTGIRRKVCREAALRTADRWTVSMSAGAAIAGRLNLPATAFGVIANGVDLERFRPADDRAALRRRLGLPVDRILFVACGSLKPVKGHGILLDAIEQMDAGIAGAATWVIVGRDYLNGHLQARAAGLPRADVRFVGEVPDAAPWLQAADAFVLPSLWEGMSNALLEAMACSCAVVATRAGGNVDVIDSESTGLLVEPGDAEALASAMGRVATEKGLRAALSAGAQQRAAAFSREAMLSACERRYAALAGAFPARADQSGTKAAEAPCAAGGGA